MAYCGVCYRHLKADKKCIFVCLYAGIIPVYEAHTCIYAHKQEQTNIFVVCTRIPDAFRVFVRV